MPRAAATGKQQDAPRPWSRTNRSSAQPLEYQILLTVTLCLLAFGAVMVYSASSAKTLLPGQGDGTGYLLRYVAYGAIGFVVLHVLARRGLEAVTGATGWLLVTSFGLLVAVKLGGVSINGARRWLGAGPLQFQPSEIMKLSLVLYAARLLARRPEVARRPRELVPLALVAGSAAALIAMQPDLGTSLVIAFTMISILVAAGMPLRHLGGMAAFGALLVTLYAASEPYRRARLTAFWDPWAHAGTIGYQFVQGQIAIGSGGVFGRGLGQSVQKIFYLPEAHTDFILAIIGEELGLVGILGVLTLYGMLAYAGFRIAQRAAGSYAKLLAAGLTSLILSQAALNTFAVLGIAPLTGVPLPFISYGSTNLVVLLACVGLLLNISVTRGVQLKVADDPRAGARGAAAGLALRRIGKARRAPAARPPDRAKRTPKPSSSAGPRARAERDLRPPARGSAGRGSASGGRPEIRAQDLRSNRTPRDPRGRGGSAGDQGADRRWWDRRARGPGAGDRRRSAG
jgi:cell division protein FtsW